MSIMMSNIVEQNIRHSVMTPPSVFGAGMGMLAVLIDMFITFSVY